MGRRRRRGVSRCETASSFLRPAHEQDPSVPVNWARYSWAMSSLRCPLAKSTQGGPWSRANRCTAFSNASVIRARGAVEAMGNLSWRCT